MSTSNVTSSPAATSNPCRVQLAARHDHSLPGASIDGGRAPATSNWRGVERMGPCWAVLMVNGTTEAHDAAMPAVPLRSRSPRSRESQRRDMVREYGVGPVKVELGQPVCPSSAPRCCPRRRGDWAAQSSRARAVDGHKPGRAPPDHFYQSSELVYKGQNGLAGCFSPRRPPLPIIRGRRSISTRGSSGRAAAAKCHLRPL